jgi:hypothetical protein
MIAFRNLLARNVALLCGLASVTATAAVAGQRASGLNGFIQQPGLSALVRREPMVFFVAKGGPNACGPSCSEWIAAEGRFDSEAAQRFRDFLGSADGLNLPIFFNSLGGYVREAHLIGMILRARRMTAGVGQTIPDGCRGAVATDESCRRLVRSKRELKAKLRTSDAHCSSACIYAFIGASIRRVPLDARIAIHAPRFDPEDTLGAKEAPQLERVQLTKKRYVLEMGVDPRLVDAAQKFDRAHFLTRDEIAGFGLETHGPYETGWMPYKDPSGQRFALKSITQGAGVGGKELRTTNVRLACAGPGFGVWFVYRRELPTSEMDVPTSIRVAAGGKEFLLGLGAKGPHDQRTAIADREFLQAATAVANIVITETFSPHDTDNWSRQVKLSTDGLAKALDDVQTDCGWPKYLNPIGASFGR